MGGLCIKEKDDNKHIDFPLLFALCLCLIAQVIISISPSTDGLENGHLQDEIIFINILQELDVT